jgi:hypothetical protein
MTAGPAAPAVIPASAADVLMLTQVIAEAFHPLPPSEWLIPDRPPGGTGHLPRLLRPARRARPRRRDRRHRARPKAAATRATSGAKPARARVIEAAEANGWTADSLGPGSQLSGLSLPLPPGD